jgi:thioredoxin-like negative regulator of GroEL
MNKINIELLNNVMTYEHYVLRATELLKEGKASTMGLDNSPEMLHYTEMNMQRMHRLDKTTKLTDETLEILRGITQPMTWLVISEAWCGDAGQIVPVLEKMAAENPLIQHLIIFRDEHPQIMDAFLTDGGRSIPMVIFLDEKRNVLGNWGPRPEALHVIIMEQKAIMLAMAKEERKAYFEKIKTEVQMWYNNDKTKSIQHEFLGRMQACLAGENYLLA